VLCIPVEIWRAVKSHFSCDNKNVVFYIFVISEEYFPEISLIIAWIGKKLNTSEFQCGKRNTGSSVFV